MIGGADTETQRGGDAERRAIENAAHCMALPFAIERAQLDDDGIFRVTGIANTFGVMHSRRILHPRGFQNWLKRTKGKQPLPMLGNHGYDAGGFATIGQWDSFELVEGVGMRWSGRVGEGTPMSDQARLLLGQRLLGQLSIGWVSLQSRWVHKDDSDLDEHFKQKMEEVGADEIYAFLDWYPLEGSIVDVADDPGARLAAQYGQQLAALSTQISELKAAVAEPWGLNAEPSIQAAIEAALKSVDSRFDQRFGELFEQLREDLVEAVQMGAELRAGLPDAYREDLAEFADAPPTDGPTDDSAAAPQTQASATGAVNVAALLEQVRAANR